MQVDKPLCRFLRAGPSIQDEYRGLFKYERLHCLCFRYGCLGHFHRVCRHLQQERTTDKLWYGAWMQADTVARTSIVWTMIREDFLQEEEKASMQNILLDHGLEANRPKEGSSGRKSSADVSSQIDTCMVSVIHTQPTSNPQLTFSKCLGGHGGCYVPLKAGVLPRDLDFLSKKQASPNKLKGKEIMVNETGSFQTPSIQIGSFGSGFPISQEGQLHVWDLSQYSSGGANNRN